ARRVASGDPPGFPENPGANLPLMRPLMTFGVALCPVFSSIVFAWFSGRKLRPFKPSGRSTPPLILPYLMAPLLFSLAMLGRIARTTPLVGTAGSTLPRPCRRSLPLPFYRAVLLTEDQTATRPLSVPGPARPNGRLARRRSGRDRGA